MSLKSFVEICLRVRFFSSSDNDLNIILSLSLFPFSIFKFLLIIFIVTSIVLLGKPYDFKSKEKIELINKLLENPDDYKNIIINSEFYSEFNY